MFHSTPNWFCLLCLTTLQQTKIFCLGQFNLYLISDKSFIKLYIPACLFLYTDNNHIEHTTELSCIISGLKEHTTYNVQVCATSAKGRGPRASLDCVTGNLGKRWF